MKNAKSKKTPSGSPWACSAYWPPRERIRRLYKKKLAAATADLDPSDRGHLETYTAKEWEKKLTLSGMADIYEQARYSNHEVTAADVKKMKDAWK
nr:DUF4129 domain-containing protein [uncultured Acetatifactor sp.]